MKISTKGRYSLRMMIDLAEHYRNEEFISLKEISKRQNISKKYMEQIIPLLNNQDLLKTLKGQHGGYMLAKHPSQITVADIISCAEGGLDIIDLDPGKNAYDISNVYMTIPVWDGLNKLIRDYLESITLQDILDDYGQIGMYVI